MTGFADEFRGPLLDPARWIDHYLPHWTTPERSAARYRFVPEGLQLRIEHDQPAWRPEDGEMRVSGLQTASHAGQHRHRPDGLAIRSPVPTRLLWAPTRGRIEIAASASPDRDCMLGLWLVGVEADSPAQSGEICIAELFGDRIGPEASVLRFGVKAHHDPRLVTDMRELRLGFDAATPHLYAAEWSETGIGIFVDGRRVASFAQRLGYPLQLMLDLFEFPASARRHPARYPKTALIHAVRGLRGATGQPPQ